MFAVVHIVIVPSVPSFAHCNNKITRHKHTFFKSCSKLSSSLPAAPFVEPRINAPEPVCQSFPTGAYSSKRLFTNPKRLPVAEPPFRVRTLPACFFAASLIFAPDPFGLPLPHPGSVCPSLGDFFATCPLPGSQPNCLLRPTDLRSPLGFLGPSGSKRSTGLPFETRICWANGFCSSRWMTRFSGRAP
jgi:hypothetical protein